MKNKETIKKQEERLSQTDLLYLKRKGLSNMQISRMTGFSYTKIKDMIKLHEHCREYSGVF